MDLTIYEKNPAVAESLRMAFAEYPDASIVLGGFEQGQPFDCFVTAGNSFGLMDGGVDRALVRYFGRELEERIQSLIVDRFLGEQPVGSCLLVDTGRADRRFVAHAPTMRVPMNIAGTDHVYLAFWSALLAIRQHNLSPGSAQIHSVATIGLGAGAGCVPAVEVGIQMSLAWAHAHAPPARITPELAAARQRRIHYGGKRGFDNARALPPNGSSAAERELAPDGLLRGPQVK